VHKFRVKFIFPVMWVQNVAFLPKITWCYSYHEILTFLAPGMSGGITVLLLLYTNYIVVHLNLNIHFFQVVRFHVYSVYYL